MLHTNEENFINLCMNLDSDPQALFFLTSTAARDFDWDYTLKKAKEKGISPIVYYQIKRCKMDTISSAVLNSFKNTYIMTAIRNECFLFELEKVLQITQKNNIGLLILKGIALVSTAYKNTALRPMVDIDILIRKSDLQRFEEVVFEAGFNSQEAVPFFYSKNRRFPVIFDVHTGIWYIKFIDEIWDRSMQVKINSTNAQAMGPCDTIIYLAAHSAVYHGHIQPLHLVDINQTMQTYHSQIDWDDIVDKIKRYNIEIPLYYVFKQLKVSLNAPVPDFVLDRLAPHGRKLIENRLYTLVLNSEPLINAGHILHPFIYKGIRAKIRFIISFLFPEKEFMLRRYRIKYKFLVYFYYPYRIVSCTIRILRLAKGLFRGAKPFLMA